MPVSTWLALIFCNVLWALNPSLAKILIHDVGPLWTAWIRCFGAFSAYLTWRCARWVLVQRSQDLPQNLKGPHFFLSPKNTTEIFDLGMIGLATFLVSPLTQMSGLVSSTAVNNSLLVALEPLFTALFGWIFLKDRLNRAHLFSFALALLGFSFLSRLISQATWVSGAVTLTGGDLILVVATAGEAAYSIFARKLMKNHQAPLIFGTALGFGVSLLTAIALIGEGGLPPLQKLSRLGFFAALWIGPVGTMLTYLFWLNVLQKGVSIGAMALTLFVQPVVGVLVGFLFLKEQLTVWQTLGAVLILTAVLIPELNQSSMYSRSACFTSFFKFFKRNK